MTEFLYAAGGVILGAVVAWVIAQLRARADVSQRTAELQAGHAAQVAELEARSRSADAIVGELRHTIEQREKELDDIRKELADEKALRVESETNLAATRESLDKQRSLIETMEQKLSDTFKALSHDALAMNTSEFMKHASSFMEMAEERLKTHTVEGSKELESKKELIGQSVEAVSKVLSEVQRKVEEVGKTSGEKITEVATLIKKHEEVTSKLKETTEHLGKALASSKKRGEWGERMAEDIVRLVGMQEGVNYLKQKTLEGAAGRPDYTFLLPHNLRINMDVKFPIDNYVQYLNAESEHDRRRYREELLKNTRVMIRQVTGREYINTAENTVDYVIIFIPNEQVYGFINESDPALMDEALRQKVILCSPFTLYAVLAVIRQAVENFNLERTASEILKLLGEFSKQWAAYKEKFKLLGDRLEGARREYDALTTTRTNVLEKPLRKIDELRKQQAIAAESPVPLIDE